MDQSTARMTMRYVLGRPGSYTRYLQDRLVTFLLVAPLGFPLAHFRAHPVPALICFGVAALIMYLLVTRVTDRIYNNLCSKYGEPSADVLDDL